jgi:hypothetical protein
MKHNDQALSDDTESTMAASMDQFTSIPNEIILGIFSHLNLRGLIAVRGVSQKWRALVPHTEGSPTRMKMLSFYDTLIASPLFLRTRPWVLKNLKASFDRQAFVDKLLRQYPFLPEEFRLWVLEWPEKAVVGGSWPGLPRKRYKGDVYADGIYVRRGENWIAFPQVSAIMWAAEANNTAEYIPALLVWRDQVATWLILDERQNLSGKIKSSSRFNLGALKDFDMITTEGPDGWIAYQRGIWDEIEDLEHPEWSMSIPWDNSMASFLQTHELPQMAWIKRNKIEGQI